jgi:hypothetical protein
VIGVTAIDTGGQPDFVVLRYELLQRVNDRLARWSSVPILLVEEVEVNRPSALRLEHRRVIRASLDHQPG